jgi:hypothetical protein
MLVNEPDLLICAYSIDPRADSAPNGPYVVKKNAAQKIIKDKKIKCDFIKAKLYIDNEIKAAQSTYIYYCNKSGCY